MRLKMQSSPLFVLRCDGCVKGGWRLQDVRAPSPEASPDPVLDQMGRRALRRDV